MEVYRKHRIEYEVCLSVLDELPIASYATMVTIAMVTAGSKFFGGKLVPSI